MDQFPFKDCHQRSAVTILLGPRKNQERCLTKN